ncbi:MAG: hypothetical protein D6748_08785 [Calditrichaeota bacterium]|nr:MAG: hypothetical protein D6748_08785 [Calditrichota bacterium]
MVKVSPRTKKTTFQITLPEAKSVALVGDFNNWSANATPMKKGKGGVWKVSLELPEGEYQFRYLVDTYDWVNDDEAPSVPNIFGSENSVAKVELPKPRAKKSTAKKSSKSKK